MKRISEFVPNSDTFRNDTTAKNNEATKSAILLRSGHDGILCRKVCHFSRPGPQLDATASTALGAGRRQNGRVANGVCHPLPTVLHSRLGITVLVLQRQFIWKGDFREQLEPDNVLP